MASLPSTSENWRFLGSGRKRSDERCCMTQPLKDSGERGELVWNVQMKHVFEVFLVNIP